METWQLKQLQSLSLAAKVDRARRRITEAYHRYDGNIYVSYSGGKDSEVLLDLVWKDFPDVPAVFVDTGLEFPEIKEQVRSHGDRVTWLRPEMSFKQVLEKHGYPVISKKMAQYIREVQQAYRKGRRDTATCRLRLTGVTTAGKLSPLGRISDKWQFLCEAPFKVSERCCTVMKKKPLAAYVKQTGRVPLMGVMASDGRQREKTFLFIRDGHCNAFAGDRPTSWPLAIWTEADIWEYIKTNGLRYSTIYDKGYTRTGCMFCAFGVQMEKGENRFQTMQRTHPQLWRYCMETLGMRDVLSFCGFKCECEQDMFSADEGAIEERRIDR